MVALYNFVSLIGYFLVMIIFVVIAILCAKSAVSWVLVVIGAGVQFLSLIGTQRNLNYWGAGDAMTGYWVVYFLLLIVGVALISARRKAAKEREEEARRQETYARRRADEEKKKQEEKKQQERELEKKQLEQSMARAFADNRGTVSDFVQRASACTTFAQMLTVWDAVNAAENGTNEVIRNEIVSMVKTERMYGSTPRELNLFLDEFQQRFIDAVIEVKEVEKVEEEPKKEPLRGIAAFNAFIEEAKQGKKFSEMLAMWKELDIGDLTVHGEVLAELTSLAKSERIYGSSSRDCTAFLDKLVKEHGSNEAE